MFRNTLYSITRTACIAVFAMMGMVAKADFIAGPNLPAPRGDVAATLLADGRVLIVGGFTAFGSPLPQTNTSLIFDPATNNYLNGAAISGGGLGRVSVRLGDGRVLVNGGGGGIVSSQSSAIYNPASNTFTVAADSVAANFHRSAMLLADGRALFFGGVPDSRFLPLGGSGEVYNPQTNTWTTLGAVLEFQRAGYTVVEVAPGQLLLAGDSSASNSAATSANNGRATPAYLYDLATATLTALPPVFLAEENTTPVKEIAVLKLADGRVLFTGGMRRDYRPGASTAFAPNMRTSIFDYTTRRFTETASAPALPVGVRLFSQGGSILALAQADPRAAAGTSFLVLDRFSLADSSWSRVGTFDLEHDGMTTGLLNNVVQLANGDLFIPGGYTNTGASAFPSARTWLIRATPAFAPTPVASVRVVSPGSTSGRVVSAGAGQPLTPIIVRMLDIAELPVINQRAAITADIANRVSCADGTLSNANGDSTVDCIAGNMVSNNVLRARSGTVVSADVITLNITAPVSPPPASNLPNVAQQLSTLAGSGPLAGGGMSGVVNDVLPTSVPIDATSVTKDREGNTYFINAGGLISVISALTGRLFTVGGTGVPGFSGDGGVATAAQFNNPTSLIFDPNGNLYVVDTGNHRIRRIAFGTFIVTTIAGGGSAITDGILGSTARLDSPRGIALDALGNLYFIDGANRILRLQLATGVLSFFAGSQTAGSSGDGGSALAARFSGITAIRFDLQGNLFILDAGNYRIRCINRSGIVVPFAGTGSIGIGGDGGLAINAQFTNLRDFAFDLFGQIYLLDGSVMRRINMHTGVISLYVLPGVTAINPVGIYIDAFSNLMLAARNRLHILRYAAAPNYGLQFQGVLAGALDSLVLSNSLSLSGFTGSVTLSIEGGEYNIGCIASAPWSSALQQLTVSNPAQQVCLRVRAGNFAGATRTAVFRVNNSGSPFTVVSPETDLLARYRVFVTSLRTHLYTTDKNEYDYLTTNFPAIYSAEGISHYLYRATDSTGNALTIMRAGQTAVPYYRLYFNAQRRHFYTSDFNEYDALRKIPGFASDERTSGSLFLRYGVPGTVPLYRLYNAAINSHLWTVDSNEFTVLKTRGWTPEGQLGNPEGVDGYVYSR